MSLNVVALTHNMQFRVDSMDQTGVECTTRTIKQDVKSLDGIQSSGSRKSLTKAIASQGTLEPKENWTWFLDQV